MSCPIRIRSHLFQTISILFPLLIIVNYASARQSGHRMDPETAEPAATGGLMGSGGVRGSGGARASGGANASGGARASGGSGIMNQSSEQAEELATGGTGTGTGGAMMSGGSSGRVWVRP